MKEYDIFMLILLLSLVVFDFIYLAIIIATSYVLAKVINKLLGGEK